MTNKTDDMPVRLYASFSDKTGKIYLHLNDLENRTPYIRADIAQQLAAALEEVKEALHKDADGVPQKFVRGDDTIYQLDGQTMYHALNKAREALAAYRALVDGGK